jgi:hypothetical protein
MRFATSLVVTLVALLLGGCGGSNDGISSSDEATESAAAVIQTKWEHTPDCDRPPGASRWGCSVGAYRCQGVVSDRGWSISCAKPGRSVAFTVRP